MMRINVEGAAFDTGNYAAVSVRRFGHEATLGPKDAQIDLAGAAEAVQGAFSALGRGIQIYDDEAGVVWYGYVAGVDAVVGSLTISRSIDGIANYVRAIGQVAGNEALAQDSLSIAAYGLHELTVPFGGDQFIDQATLQVGANTVLATLKDPPVSFAVGGTGGAQPTSTLRCKGPAYSMAWRYVDEQIDDVTQVDSATYLQTLINAKAAHLGSAVVEAASGVLVNIFQDGTRRTLDVVQEVLGLGMGTARLALKPSAGLPGSAKHGVRIGALPTDPTRPSYLVDSYGRVTLPEGTPVAAASLRAGFWLAARDYWVGSKPLYASFVESAAFEVAGQAWTWQPGGRRDSFDSLRLTVG